MFFDISQSVDFDTPYTFFFFDFLYHCYGAETRPDSIGLRHSADPFTFREQRFQSFSARLQLYQGRFRDFLRAFEPALEALGGVLELSWSYFGLFHEHP